MADWLFIGLNFFGIWGLVTSCLLAIKPNHWTRGQRIRLGFFAALVIVLQIEWLLR